MVSFSDFMELWFSKHTPLQDVIVVILSILFIIIKVSIKGLQNRVSKVNLKINEGALYMGIHYDYKSTRGISNEKKPSGKQE